MRARQTITSERSRVAFRRDDGAALIVAIGILTILLIIGLTFFQMAQREMSAATNTGNQMRAELMAEGATAVAIAFLNHDLAIHPTYTSLDHAWRTYFNGAWAVGKDWSWQNGVPIVGGGLPIVDLPNMPDLDLDANPLKVDRLFTSEATADSLYYPRMDLVVLIPAPPTELGAQTPADLAGTHPFVVATNSATGDSGDSPASPGAIRFRPSQIDLWTDVDNDGDDLNDSIWIPIAADQITFLDDDGQDNDVDGFTDEGGEDDGIDNDLDNFIDNPEGEVKVFLYNGALDGLDNDGDGLIDELDEDGQFDLFDNDGDTFVDEPGEIRVFLTAQLHFRTDEDNLIDVFDLVGLGNYSGGAPVVPDTLDNDHNLVIGNNEVFLIDPTLPESPDNPITIARAHYFLGDRTNVNGYLSTDMVDELDRLEALPGPGDYEVWGSAEPVSDIVGRMAVLITDESSKVNLNSAGGRSFNPSAVDATIPMTRSMNLGIGPHEYESRVLPGIGPARSDRLWMLMTGVRQEGLGFGSDVHPRLDPTSVINEGNYDFDVSLPGYGRVDDNGNQLWLALNGIDDDGDEVGDEGITAGTLGEFEGLDEPQELQRFRPFRNLVAEGDVDVDFIDNDLDGTVDEVDDSDNDQDNVINERSEFGDRVYRTYEQTKLINGIAEGIFGDLRNLTTVHSNDRNNRYQHSTDGVSLLASRGRTLTGLKLDYNFAMAEDVAKMLRDDFGLTPAEPTPADAIVESFALGLRREDTDVVSDDAVSPGFMFGQVGGPSTVFPADPELRASQLAATTKDFRDRDHTRSEVSTITDDTWWVDPSGPDPGGTARDITYTSSGIESIRINEIMVRPVRRVEAEMDIADPLLDPNGFEPPASLTRDFTMTVDQIGAAWSLYTAQPVAVIGYDTTYSTTAVLTAGGQYLTPPVSIPDVPNVIQFEFEQTNEMPPGRYYLTVNTQFVDGSGRRIATALQPGDIEFTTKYVRAGVPAGDVIVGTGAVDSIRVDPDSIVEDIMNGVRANDLQLVEDVWKPAIIGFENMDAQVPGTESGLVFFPTDAVRVDTALAGYDTDFDGYFQNEAYSVELLPAASGVTLQVGIRIGSGALAAGRLDINFFDFSQEPDHEWIELVNIAESLDDTDAVDVSGWKLVVEGPKRTVMTIPDQTFIAPNGYLLLGMNKYDSFATGVPNANGILYENGIGLARSDGALTGTIPFDNLEEVTVPPIGDLGDNVFERSADLDYTDNDGDGVDGLTPGEDDVQSTLAPGFPVANDKAWDRIVELQVDRLRGITDPEALAHIILSGGIFPNYPEHDGIDNDGDNAILNADDIDNDGDGVVDENIASDNVDNNGNNAVLISDGIDNDGDGVIDEVNEGVDEPGETDTLGTSTDTLDDGIDEGRWARPLAGTGPASSSRPPGSFSEPLIPYFTTPSGTFDQEYIGGDRDPVEWKAFTERRWYPGDSVIITLYEAAPFQEGMRRVVDRITYTERDVVNRSVDDILSTDIGGTLTLDRVPLHPAFDYYWPDDTMGIDFYKSLERKHPLYAGDRFGTQNRWQATDGNYDDWADRTSEWERETQSDGTVTDPFRDREGDALFNHAFSGSPLRKNLSQRYIESRNVQFLTDNTNTSQNYVANVRWAFENDSPPMPQRPLPRARVRNRDLVSSANLLAAPHFRQQLDLDRVQTAGQLTINESLFDLVLLDRFHQDISPEEGLMGQRELLTAIPTTTLTVTDTRVVTALIGAGAASAPLVLTTGQAEVTPLSPALLVQYSWAPLLTLPEGWAPVLIYDLPSDGVAAFSGALDYEQRPLLTRPATLPGTVDSAAPGLPSRSPLESRSVMYVSGNLVGFLDSDPHTAGNGAESFFLWDDDDGLENGEYDLYLSLGDDLSTFETNPADTLLTGFGISFIATAAATLPEQMEVDVEVYTDRNRDGRVYTGVVPLAGLGQLDATESFGQQHGLAPGPDGYVRYGTVRVENNVLGVMLRNRTPEGNMIRFSRVILTPRDRTPGRININTTITRDTDGAGGANFNSLMGLPGLLARPADADDVVPGDLILDTIDPAGVGGINIEALTRQIAKFRELGIVGGIDPAIPAGLPNFPADGRYYEFVSDLGSHVHGRNPFQAPPPPLPEFDSPLRAEAGITDGAQVFDEMKVRLERLQNLVTVRSDVFEILVTVQSGYGVDANGDGIINYRDADPDDPEFVVTAERTSRTIYER